MPLLFALISISSLFLIGCLPQPKQSSPPNGFVRVNATIQEYNEVQPWDRKSPMQRRGLGALIDKNKILTTSEMVSNSVYLELESANGSNTVTAKVTAIDRDANLAILEPESKDDCFLDLLTPLELAPPLDLNSRVQTWQLENNGQPTVTTTNIFSVNVVPTYSQGKRFFSYLLKGSLQSASNSYTVPVLAEGKLAGILTSYDSEDQISEVVSSSLIKLFLDDANDGEYLGFPSLGIAGARMPDQAFRDWIGLDDKEEGLFLTRIGPNSAAAEADLQVGDVLLALDGFNLSRKGYYTDSQYGKLSWTHLIRGSKKVGDSIQLKLKRNGKILLKDVVLKQTPTSLIPQFHDPRGPQYYLKGGMIFQHLTKKYLQAFGKDWRTRAPLNLLDIYFQPEEYEKQFKEIVIITGVIPSRNTVGYEGVRNTIVKKVNNVKISSMSDLDQAFSQPQDGIHHIELSEPPYQVYLDAKGCVEVDQALLKQGLQALKRVHPKI